MARIWRSYMSYNIWLQFSPAVGQEYWHCDMKRGFARARQKEPQVAALVNQDNVPQRIGHLAQIGVYEFHKDPSLLYRRDAVDRLKDILQLNQESTLVQARVVEILYKYLQDPILLNKEIVQLNRGDEGIPEPILLKQGNYQFHLFAAIDCIVKEPDGTLNILDLKTGKSNFDRRQAYVYLLAARYLYPTEKAITTFYNLETGDFSEKISATSAQLNGIKMELARLAKQHQQDLKRYRNNKTDFNKIFPANPGIACRNCIFDSICNFSKTEVSA